MGPTGTVYAIIDIMAYAIPTAIAAGFFSGVVFTLLMTYWFVALRAG